MIKVKRLCVQRREAAISLENCGGFKACALLLMIRTG
jgi:hypothetical protein